MIPLCPVNETLFNPWIDDGINRCFVYTLSSSLLAGLAIIPCCLQLFYYRKYAFPIDGSIISRSKLFHLQVATQLFVAMLAFAHAVVYEFMVAPIDASTGNRTYGFTILEGVLVPISWLLLTATLYSERGRALPSTPSRGHGLILLACWFVNFVLVNLPFISFRSRDWWWHLKTGPDAAEFSIWLLQYKCALFILLLGLKAPGLPNYAAHYARLNAEMGDNERGARRSSGLHLQLSRIKALMPYVWPKRSCLLQFQVMTCIFVLVAGRVINLYTPIFYKEIVDSLTPVNSTFTFSSDGRLMTEWAWNRVCSAQLIYRWDLVLTYVGLRLLQGLGAMGSGLIGGLRAQLWVQVDQYSSRELAVDLFRHIHELSMNWHLSRKTGEVLRIVDRGTSSISNILNYLVFNILPTIADIIIGVVYFMTAFNVWYGLIVLCTMVLYLAATIGIVSWRTKHRKEMNSLQNEVEAVAVDSLINFETVKYYSAEHWEVDRYRESMLKFQHANWVAQTSLNFLNQIQNLIITLGLLVGTLLCVKDVVNGHLKVGDFVLFCTYIIQLYLPLNLFGTYYRMLQASFIDMENMFELLEVKPSIQDEPDARPIVIKSGKIEFRNVCFHYVPERPILKNVSFTVDAGQTVALVGQTGSGKSTLIRLLFRFYDVTQGDILVDDQSVRKITASSLRNCIGVVPQDTVLFNSNIRFNIGYGRRDATDAEVEEAASMADIHERILEFPQQYETIVGERGLKLSGGEKQRIAIARTILKAPKIVLLDEATSSLDTETERNIQGSLDKVARNRTTIIVAHRLSTVVHANVILVMHRGEIVERGTHDELLIQGGRYSKLWNQQIRANETEVIKSVPVDDDLSGEEDSTVTGTSSQAQTSSSKNTVHHRHHQHRV